MASTKQFNPRGLTEVHRPATGTPLVDIVFVHGLDGDPRSTWTSEKDKVFWPSQLLPSKLEEEKARILVYGYDANVTRSRNGPATVSKEKIHNHGEQLVAELCGNRSKPEAAKRPIIFVAHSLGGLVVKSALIHSYGISGSKTRRLRSIFVSTYGIVFLGTPHQGFDVREWIAQKELACDAREPDECIRTQSHIVDALQCNSETLQVLDRRFIDLTNKFRIFLFHEGEPTTINGKQYYIVKEESAAPVIQDVECATIHQDHAHMCQFDNENTPGFGLVTEALQRYASEAPQVIEAAWLLEHKEHQVKIVAEVGEKLGSTSLSGYETSPNTASSKAIDLQNKRHYIVPRTQVKNFIGREAQLSQISSHFSNDRFDNQPQILIIYALGGQGKSQLVLEYCSLSREIYGGVFWVNASSERLAMQSYAQIGTALGIASSAIMEKNNQMVNLIKEHLEGWSQRWLLVFDNYDKPKSFLGIQEFIPQCECSSTFFRQGRVIFTSRNGQLDLLGHHLMEIPAMNAKEGVSLLLRRHKDEDIGQYFTQASSIVERLGGLPLAIDQAAAYIHYRRLPLPQLDKFLTIYDTKRKDILLHTPGYFWEYTTSQVHGEEEQAKAINAFTTWEMSLDQLKSDRSLDSENLIHLLTLSAFFNPTRIEEFLFRNHCKKNSQMASWLRCISTDEEETSEGSNNEASDHDEDLNEVSDEGVSHQDSSSRDLDILWDSDKYWALLSAFHELSLLQSLEKAGEDAVFSLHPLIRDWLQLRAEKKKRQTYIKESAEVVTTSVRFNFYKVMNLEYNSALLTHVDACLTNDEQFSKKQHQLGNRIENCDTAIWLALFFAKQGRYQEAEKLLGKIVATEQRMLGLEHENTMRDMDLLAATFREQNKYDEAEVLFRQTLQLRKKLLGEKNEDTMKALERVAFVLHMKAKYDDADKLYRQVLPWRLTELGQDDPKTLSTMRNWAMVMCEQGKNKEAEEMQRQTLHLTGQVLGSEHPDYVLSMYSLASTLYNQSKYIEAEQLQRQVLYLRENSLGKTHPYTLHGMSELALTLGAIGKYEEAERLQRETLQLRQEVLGKKNPDTLISMNNLALLLDSQSSVGAQEMYRETLELRKQVLGMRHPETLKSMSNLALMLPDLEAEPIFRETLGLRQEVLGCNHTDTLATMNDLAYVLPDHEAEPLYRETLLLKQEVLGSNHPATLQTMHNLACRLPHQTAEPLFRETLRLRQEVLGSNHPATLQTMHHLAQILSKHEAEPLFRETLRLQQEVLGSKHPHTLTTMQNLASILPNHEAEALFHKTLRLRQEVLGKKHPSTLRTMKWLAYVLREQGKNDEAEEIEQQQLELQQQDDGDYSSLNEAGGGS